ncbi:MAG: hypothetical protein KF746_20665 [Chitinophagaceae bacterium]|nr:hypothetical protein [Chitinophagaceae bacterium]
MIRKAFILLLCTITTVSISNAQVSYLGKQPGNATVVSEAQQAVLENDILKMEIRQANKKIRLAAFRDKVNKQAVTLPAGTPLFSLLLANGTLLTSNDFTLKDEVTAASLPGDPGERTEGRRADGKMVTAVLENAQTALQVEWKAELRNGSNYVRQTLSFTPGKEIDITKFRVISFPAAIPVKKQGTVDGSPVTYQTMFFAVENPLSKFEQSKTVSVLLLPRALPLVPGETFAVSSVWGVTPAKQLRRGFLYYLERERTNTYRQLLHYNSWYDLSYADRILNDSLCLDRIKVWGDSLITKRNVPMNAFLFDDGWDDYKTLWQFHKGFPDGFTNVRNAALQYGAGIGVWMSPWGGYDIRKPQRLEYGAKQNPPFETNENGFSLAGPVYYKRFSEVTADFIKKYNVSMFKFDGLGAGNGTGGVTGQYQKDVEAMLRLIHELRALKPDLFLSLTIGTWPSVYWLYHGDVIWRAGDDTGLGGKGPKRQQWMNYRDGQTYRNVVQRAPFYPLSALMYHGLCIADQGIPGKLEMDDKDIADEIWSFFATGTSLQEMYVNPHKLNTANWDCLKQAIEWARSKADLMPDVHWVGGDPAKDEVYGYAAWSEKGGYVSLRNPSDKKQSFEVDVARLFDIPDHAMTDYAFSNARKETGKEQPVAQGRHFTITLEPFEVKILDAVPL